MNPQLTQFSVMMAWMVMVVSMMAGLSYYVVRLLARRHLFLNIMAGCAAIGFVLLLAMIATTDLSYLVALIWLLVCSGIGSFLHRSSYAVRPTWSSGFLLMFNVAEATLSLSFLLMNLSDPIIPYFSTYALNSSSFSPIKPFASVDLALVFACACFTAPLAVTVLLRIFQSSKIRPGLDHH